MATHEERAQMTRYVTGRLDASKQYTLHVSEGKGSFDVIFAHEKNPLDGIRHNYAVILHSSETNDAAHIKEEIRDFVDQELTNGIIPAHIFYKDGRNFFVYAKNKHKKNEKRLKDTRSLSRYAVPDRMKFINIGKPGNDLEKRALSYEHKGDFVMRKDKHIAYYQPLTKKHQEGIRTFSLHPVMLNYGYIPTHERIDRKLNLNEESKDMFFPEEMSGNKQGAVILQPYSDHAKIIHADKQLPLISPKVFAMQNK